MRTHKRHISRFHAPLQLTFSDISAEQGNADLMAGSDIMLSTVNNFQPQAQPALKQFICALKTKDIKEQVKTITGSVE